MWKEDNGVSCLCNVLQLHYFHQSSLQSEENTLGLYDLGKSLQEWRPAPLIFKALDLDATFKENKLWWVSSLA